jgi:general secretion pathway protein I
LNARTHKTTGFTLLEVLVAVVIISLGMIAVFSQLSQMLRVAESLRNRTFAQWIAVDRITELQATGEYPNVGDRQDTIEMASTEWAYTIKISQIPDQQMRRVDVSVGFADTPDQILADVAGFIAAPQLPAGLIGGANPDQNPGQNPGQNPNQPSPGIPQTGMEGIGIGTGFGVDWAPIDANDYDSEGAP